MFCARTTVLLLAALAPAPPKAPAGDWPGWRGPDRTGVSAETGLLKRWPGGGPKLLWKATGLGGRYSTPAVSGGRIYLLGTRDRKEHVIALAAGDGQEVWAAEVGPVA